MREGGRKRNSYQFGGISRRCKVELIQTPSILGKVVFKGEGTTMDVLCEL